MENSNASRLRDDLVTDDDCLAYRFFVHVSFVGSQRGRAKIYRLNWGKEVSIRTRVNPEAGNSNEDPEMGSYKQTSRFKNEKKAFFSVLLAVCRHRHNRTARRQSSAQPSSAAYSNAYSVFNRLWGFIGWSDR